MSMIKYFRILTFACLLLHAGFASGNDRQVVRVGVLQFGTVNWELDVIKHHNLDSKYGIDLRVTPLGGKNATHVALQGGAVDIIVSDWIWVSRQRNKKRDYSFSPYSNAVGSLMVNPDAGITTLSDLHQRRLGVAGGALDKTWLLLRAYSLKTNGSDLADLVSPNFAAPPLLNQLALRGEMDAAINFWHYAARLKAAGFKPLLEMPEILNGLGIKRPIPLIGWVFSDSWAKNHQAAMQGFLQASREAKHIMLTSDDEWHRLRPRMKASNESIFVALRDGFRTGIPQCFGKAEKAAARDTFSILARVGGQALVGHADQLSDGTFWPGFKLDACSE